MAWSRGIRSRPHPFAGAPTCSGHSGVATAWPDGQVVDTADEQERANLVNAMLAASAAHPRLSNHADDGWHIHYREEHRHVGPLLFGLISMGTALHLAGRSMHRLRRCATTECTTIFADTSRTGRQRYCSPRCANRDAVRRHRARTAFVAPL